jgi:hypothetical protein
MTQDLLFDYAARELAEAVRAWIVRYWETGAKDDKAFRANRVGRRWDASDFRFIAEQAKLPRTG